ncbi:hypothetical protein E2562_034969 [Oryza meyeriana var. granulata]|uniref:Uncharacterized protein n=1 Tax=Oryza meyeriana var. granulata TaxID=110450 RepID=A0A6G1BPP4_9ORYZ|nr:hypothetical protein E2562_034969 [Oryza meyeriana var. granulata]
MAGAAFIRWSRGGVGQLTWRRRAWSGGQKAAQRGRGSRDSRWAGAIGCDGTRAARCDRAQHVLGRQMRRGVGGAGHGRSCRVGWWLAGSVVDVTGVGAMAWACGRQVGVMTMTRGGERRPTRFTTPRQEKAGAVVVGW